MKPNTMLAAVAALMLGAQGAAAETVLRFANFEPPQAVSQAQIFTPWADYIAEASEGRLRIEFYAGGALGPDPRAQLDLVTNGVADIAWVFPFFTPAQFPQTGLAELPMEIPDAVTGTAAMNALFDRGLLHEGLDRVTPLGIFSAPPGIYFMDFEPQSLDDLRGRRAAASGPIRNQIMENLGLVPVGGVNVGNMAESLSRGTIDVGQMNFTAAHTFRVNDVAHHAVAIDAGASMLFVLINNAVLERLSPEDQQVLIDGRAVLEELWNTVIGDAERQAEEAFRAEEGRSVLDFTPEELDALKQSLAPITDAWVAATPNGAEMLAALREEVQRLQAQ
ncbi:MAG: TRAP transporter substrate-binding protein DctP [Rhodobacteraceae bacterium]|nr:TRAP transporter substrate-binding protein DctP [Paracoccaceae bacterium]